MHHDNSRHDKRFKLKVRHVVLGIFAVLLAAGILHLALLSSGANRRLAALRAAGQPTSLAELAQRNKLPMGMENAARLYESAFTFFTPPADPNVPYVGKADPRDRRVAVPEAVAAAAADCLAANAQCLALLHEAAAIRDCRYDYEYGRASPPFDAIRSCARLLKLAAVSHASNGDAAGAVASITDGLCLSNSLSHEPFLIAHLVHIACKALAITSLERVLTATTLTDAQLQDLDQAVVTAGEQVDLTRTLVSERCFMIESMADPSLVGAERPWIAVFRLPGVKPQGLIDLLDHMEASIQALDLPPAQQAARFREIGRRLDNLSPLHLVAKTLAPALSRIADLNLRFRAHVDLSRTALTIERHRLATGKLPDQLADLVPAYLAEVPIDPFDGRPIRYRLTEPGYVVYSIMEDGQDNGGKEREDVGRGEPGKPQEANRHGQREPRSGGRSGQNRGSRRSSLEGRSRQSPGGVCGGQKARRRQTGPGRKGQGRTLPVDRRQEGAQHYGEPRSAESGEPDR